MGALILVIILSNLVWAPRVPCSFVPEEWPPDAITDPRDVGTAAEKQFFPLFVPASFQFRFIEILPYFVFLFSVKFSQRFSFAFPIS